MLCIKCKRELPENAVYCSYCGRKQTAAPPKYHKREHGTGTIRCDKRYKKPWIAVAPSSKYGTGRQYIGSYATRREAAEALDDFIRNGRPELYNATVAEIYTMWSKIHYKRVGEAAVKLYTYMWKRFADVADLPIRELRTAHIQEIVNAATSKSSCEIIKTMAVMLCSFAMENDIVQKNYAEFVKIPKFEKKEKRIFTKEEINKLWKHSDEKCVQAVLFMIYTGFRIGEMVKLRVEDVNITEGYLIGGEKTDAGKNRIVPLSPNIPELKLFISEWLASASGSRLFPLTVSKFRKEIFNAALSTSAIDPDGLTPHATRHTFASISAAAGIQPENLQKIIGHANYATTADVYIHQDLATLISEMSKLRK